MKHAYLKQQEKEEYLNTAMAILVSVFAVVGLALFIFILTYYV